MNNMKKTTVSLILIAIIIAFGALYLVNKSRVGPNIDLNSNSNGNSIGNGAGANTNPFSEKCGLKITSIRSGDTVKFPLTISGVADMSKYKELGCNWIRFEGQAGIVQVMANINNSGWIPMTTQTPLMADDWMATTTPVRAELVQVLNREIPIGTPLIIKFIEEDVEGSGKSDTLEIPAIFGGLSGIGDVDNNSHNGGSNSSQETMKISLYFHDESKINMDCSATYKVDRTVPKTLAVADTSLRVLFSEDLKELAPLYNSVVIKNKVAIVDFDSGALKYLNGAACMQGTFKGPIEDTLKQYPTIEKVEYSIDGKIWDEWDA